MHKGRSVELGDWAGNYLQVIEQVDLGICNPAFVIGALNPIDGAFCPNGTRTRQDLAEMVSEGWVDGASVLGLAIQARVESDVPIGYITMAGRVDT